MSEKEPEEILEGWIEVGCVEIEGVSVNRIVLHRDNEGCSLPLWMYLEGHSGRRVRIEVLPEKEV